MREFFPHRTYKLDLSLAAELEGVIPKQLKLLPDGCHRKRALARCDELYFCCFFVNTDFEGKNSVASSDFS